MVLGMERGNDQIRTLAASVEAAATTLLQVAERIDESTSVGREIHQAADVIGNLKADLTGIESGFRDVHLDQVRHGWVLDNGWRRFALQIGSQRPRVMLTIAANALCILSALYGDLIDERWEWEVEHMLKRHHHTIMDLRQGLLEMRGL